MRGSDRFWENNLGRSTGTIPMIKSLVVPAAVTIGLAGYAFAQNTITGAPAGTARRHPPRDTPVRIPGVTPPRRARIKARRGTGQTGAGKGLRPQPTTCATNLRRQRPKILAAQASTMSLLRAVFANRKMNFAGTLARPRGSLRAVDHAFLAGGGPSPESPTHRIVPLQPPKA
jgi:hypothetical protein